MLDGDRGRIELLYSLLFTLPGSPVLLYGEEIGLGDDQRVEGRGAVRVAMQWTAGPNAGFSAGDPTVPLVSDGPFGPDQVNVVSQRRDPQSLLNWMERAIRTRKELPELGWGTWQVLDADQPTVLPTAAIGRAEESSSSTTSGPRQSRSTRARGSRD